MTSAVSVLAVDDEQLVLEMVVEALQEGGFEVISASTAKQAMGLLEARTAELGALVTDVRLGGRTTGFDIATRARELRPDLPVVYMSGADLAEWSSKGVPKSMVVAKPFAPAQIVTAVSTLLNAASVPGGPATG